MSSKSRRGGLGRGLGALIPTAPTPQAPPSQATGSSSSSTGAGPSVTTATRPDGPAERDNSTGESSPGPTDSAAERPEFGPSSGLSPRPSTEAVGTVTDGATNAAADNVASAQNTTVNTTVNDALTPVAGAIFADLAIGEIHANAKQPRQVFDQDALAELTHSIREFGVLQPIVVRADDEGYELVMGERRLRAGIAAGLETIPAIIRTTADDAMLRDALLENIHRAQLNPLEEAAAYQQLLEEFGTTHDELAQRIGRSRPQVTNTIRLLNLSIPVQRRVAAGVLSAGHARALLGLPDQEAQDELASRIVAEGLSVRATEELVSLHSSGQVKNKPARHSPTRRITAPAIDDLAGKLSDTFDTRVRVELGRRKGKITVEFASIDDLERIVAVMAPEISGRRTPHAPPAADQATTADQWTPNEL